MIYSFERQETLDIQGPSMLKDIRGSSMLKQTSRFVLEVLPYVLSALIAAIVVPWFLYSQAHGTKPAVTPNVPGLEMIHRDHAMLVPDSVKTAEGKVAYR
jgi:hypothetical protein